MRTLQLIIPLQFTKPKLRPQIHRPLQTNRREKPILPSRTWRLHSGAKGFTSRPKGGEPMAGKGSAPTTAKNYEDDDKIPDVVWQRMVWRILFNVGVPLAIGFALLRGFDVVIENKLWDVPKWLPFLTIFITFGASALGIAYGSLSTSLNAEEEGSFLGFEQIHQYDSKDLKASSGKSTQFFLEHER